MTRLRYTVRQRIPTGTPGGWPPGLLLLLAWGMLMFGCCWCGCAAFLAVRLFGL
jgi:hypothetical protein